MARSLKKGPFVCNSLLLKISNLNLINSCEFFVKSILVLFNLFY